MEDWECKVHLVEAKADPNKIRLHWQIGARAEFGVKHDDVPALDKMPFILQLHY